MSPRVCVPLALLLAAVLLPAWTPAADTSAAHDDVDLTLVEGGRDLTNSIGMKLVRIPAGKFQMGSPADEKPRYGNEGLLVDVEITKDFYLGVFEVTQKQYKLVMGVNPSYFCKDGKGKDAVKDVSTDDFPVEMTSWEDAVEFCKKLSNLSEENAAGRKYRVPTEAEWEYACRGGAKAHTTFWTGNVLTKEQANFDGKVTKKVGSYKPNGFGLYDMTGNVYEWVADWIGDFYKDRALKRDPLGPDKGDTKVIRGGSWRFSKERCRTADRCAYPPKSRHDSVGFRVAMTTR